MDFDSFFAGFDCFCVEVGVVGADVILGALAFILVHPYLMFWVIGVSMSRSLRKVSGLQLGQSKSSRMMPSVEAL